MSLLLQDGILQGRELPRTQDTDQTRTTFHLELCYSCRRAVFCKVATSQESRVPTKNVALSICKCVIPDSGWYLVRMALREANSQPETQLIQVGNQQSSFQCGILDARGARGIEEPDPQHYEARANIRDCRWVSVFCTGWGGAGAHGLTRKGPSPRPCMQSMSRILVCLTRLSA